MLLTIDAGNTTVMHGVYKDQTLLGSWRLLSSTPRTSDEWGMTISVQAGRMGWSPEDITGIIVSSVVPEINQALEEMCRNYLDVTPMFVGPELDLGLEIKYTDPRQVGADRICGAVAGRARYGYPLIIIDFGTATTFDVVDGNGDYFGGVIAPGIAGASSILHHGTAKLPQVELRFPGQVIGQDTDSSIQSGIMYGELATLEGLIPRIREELGAPAPVVATGGQSILLQGRTELIQHFDRDLVLAGLQILYERNRGVR
jgi:type III pantothenate kinase